VAVLACAASAAWGAAREEDVAVLRSRIEALKADLASKETDRREARDALRASEAAISDSSRSLRALDARARAAREATLQLDARQRDLEKTLLARRDALGRLLSARALEQVSGIPDVVRLLLAGEHPNETARNLVYLAYLSRAASGVIESHRAGLLELERLRAESQARASETAQIEALQRADRERILLERRERRQVLERIGREMRSSDEVMRTLVKDEQKLAMVVERIAEILVERPGAGYSEGPVQPAPASSGAPGVTFSTLRGKLISPVGELLPAGRVPNARKGVFLRAREGESVRAVAAGRVVYADWMRGLGNLLIVDHGEAYLSIYGNNESLLRQTGDSVSAGEVVATVGATGGSQESGLYFELRHLGRAFDPLRWLKRN
jgi:septal ring factor EnvC (AmiA/AmiB activator)